MAITNQDDLVSAIAAAKTYAAIKASSATEGTGTYSFLWLAASGGGANATGRTVGSGYTCNATTQGSLLALDGTTFPANVTAPADTFYLLQASGSSNAAVSLTLYDRLAACSNFSGTVNTTQDITNNLTLPARETGEGVELWLDFYGATGATGVNLTVNIINTNNATVACPVLALAANAPTANESRLVPLPANTTGCQAVVNATLSATTGTAGNFGFTLRKRIADITIPQSGLVSQADYAQLGLPIVKPDACLEVLTRNTGSATGQVLSYFTIGQK